MIKYFVCGTDHYLYLHPDLQYLAIKNTCDLSALLLSIYLECELSKYSLERYQPFAAINKNWSSLDLIWNGALSIRCTQKPY